MAVPLQTRDNRPDDDKSIGDVVTELWALLKTYAKQETVDPLKGIGRFVAFGAPGSILLGTGVLFLTLGLLRALQTQTDRHLTGHLTWVPYLVTLVVATVFVLLALAAIRRSASGGRRDERRAHA